ncbi:MAG TPA: ribosome biogenesis GTP-binding protein YihA/YsxC [Hyphomicrobiales bacterium]|nr:ribosome biogenesis GTP-binding protein YihA/YsxC [Hyphomicrobiales bacterium]
MSRREGVEAQAASAASLELFKAPADFVLGVADVGGLPASDRPEVAFAGRSNVGKSSLLNALLNRRKLARVSNTPGRTRELNYYSVGDRLFIVDMPGYGYAKAPKDLVKGWTRLIHDYLRGRAQLKRVMLLVDSRHGLKNSDREIMTLLDRAAVSYQAVLTKSDKPKAGDLGKIIGETAEELRGHPAAHPAVLATSALTGQGIDELREAIAELC